MKASVPKLCN